MAVSTYRGYRITVRSGTTLGAIIHPPNFPLAMNEIPTATHAEGEAVLMARARAVIDADIENTANGG